MDRMLIYKTGNTKRLKKGFMPAVDILLSPIEGILELGESRKHACIMM
jgi:hypothetical protein